MLVNLNLQLYFIVMFNNKVLIVDDDFIVRILYFCILVNIGLIIILVKNGLEVLEKVK